MRFLLVPVCLGILAANVSQVTNAADPERPFASTAPRPIETLVPFDANRPAENQDSQIVATAPQSAPPDAASIQQCAYTSVGSPCDLLPGGDSCSGVGGATYGSCDVACAGIEEGMVMRSFDLAYASLDLLFLGRDVDDFLLVGTDGGARFFEESLSHGFEPGLRLNLGLRLWGNGFIEARHARVGGWEADGNFQPLPGDPGAIAAQGIFEADYHSTDINLVAEDPINNEYQLLLGLRFIEQGDSFETTLSNRQTPAVIENYAGRADNSMFGVHAGFRTGWFYRKAYWSVNLLGGVLNNQTSQRGPRFDTALVLDGVADPQFSVTDEEVSVFADIEGSVAYPIFDSTYVRVG
ncbi:MAG: hypothetical protein AAGA03_13425, partial [Planctomycetota bacterium]